MKNEHAFSSWCETGKQFRIFMILQVEIYRTSSDNVVVESLSVNSCRLGRSSFIDPHCVRRSYGKKICRRWIPCRCAGDYLPKGRYRLHRLCSIPVILVKHRLHKDTGQFQNFQTSETIQCAESWTLTAQPREMTIQDICYISKLCLQLEVWLYQRTQVPW